MRVSLCAPFCGYAADTHCTSMHRICRVLENTIHTISPRSSQHPSPPRTWRQHSGAAQPPHAPSPPTPPFEAGGRNHTYYNGLISTQVVVSLAFRRASCRGRSGAQLVSEAARARYGLGEPDTDSSGANTFLPLFFSWPNRCLNMAVPQNCRLAAWV